MTRDPFPAFMANLVREYTRPKASYSGKWEWWTDGRKRSQTICVWLRPDSAELTVAHRGIGTDGCMCELNAVSCDLEHLPKLAHALNRALAVAIERGLIKQNGRRVPNK
jgi:hypothetical protein